MAATQLVDEVGVQPRLVDLQLGVGQQAITIETLDIVTFIGATVTPNVDAVFFHRRNQHGAGDRTAQRGGVEIGQAAGGVVERTTLNSRDTFSDQLLTAVNQARVLCSILFSATRNGIIVVLIRLTQVRSIGIRNRSLLAHPQQCSAGIQAT
ncbi:Uncharacterised protein [Enterobacter cloacae]|uniref:Uncharacterized protein n=1 Tax=Enterobacter cloacae TaxID=550 RepID=A0A144G3C7_ENTCL|nr:Uncharacterised protein [Enterobacter cloacae]SAG19851.1 Uncharacterised protein [Enterobacter cloacae]